MGRPYRELRVTSVHGSEVVFNILMVILQWLMLFHLRPRFDDGLGNMPVLTRRVLSFWFQARASDMSWMVVITMSRCQPVHAARKRGALVHRSRRCVFLPGGTALTRIFSQYGPVT